MAAPIIQADYDRLAEIARQFGRNAEAASTLQGQVQRSAQALRAGGWEGRGSAAFFAEMDDEIAPALQRLTSALRQAQDVSGQIGHLMRQAEEEAAEPFRGDSIYTIILLSRDNEEISKSNPGISFPGPLTSVQLNLSKEAAKKFGLPPELVAGTVAVEIVDDTDWYDKLLDDLFQKYPLNLHYSSFAREQSPLLYAATEWFLNGYEDYFGFLGGRGPGNGVANVHIATAKSVEDYFAKYYSDQHLLDTPASGYARSRVLLTDSGNIYYTAAYLRMTADYRTGIRGSHITDLDDFDMQMIYGRFRCDCWDSWAEFAKATDLPHLTTGLDSRGQVLAPFLKLYRIYYERLQYDYSLPVAN